jgi:hypothetical protein
MRSGTFCHGLRVCADGVIALAWSEGGVWACVWPGQAGRSSAWLWPALPIARPTSTCWSVDTRAHYLGAAYLVVLGLSYMMTWCCTLSTDLSLVRHTLCTLQPLKGLWCCRQDNPLSAVDTLTCNHIFKVRIIGRPRREPLWWRARLCCLAYTIQGADWEDNGLTTGFL